MTRDDDESNAFDWDLLVTSRLNAILCGERATLDVMLAMLRSHLALPQHEWSLAKGSSLPALTTGTLILRDLLGSTLDQQRAFLEWLDGRDALRVITVSERPLFGLVEHGVLLEQLYYRLNPMYCPVHPDGRTSSARIGRSSAA